MRCLRAYSRATAECAATRGGAEADRQGARSGTAAAMPAVLCQGAGYGVDQLEGDELTLVGRRLRPLGLVLSLSAFRGETKRRRARFLMPVFDAGKIQCVGGKAYVDRAEYRGHRAVAERVR